MPLWSVEEWRARIGSSWAALGRPIGCSRHCKQTQRHVCCSLAGGGGGMVVSTVLMITTVTLLMLSMSLITVLPLEAGCSPLLHTGSRMCYHGNTSSVWRRTSHLFLVLWNKLSSWSNYTKQLVAIVVTMELETAAAVLASLLLRCGDIELNPGPLGREDFEKVDNSHTLTEKDFHSIYSELVTIKANYYQLGIGLGLPPGELQAIRKGAQDIEQAFVEVLLAWLRCCQNIDSFGPPTWRGLVEAANSPAGGNNPALAMDIAARHPATSTPAKRMKLAESSQPLSSSESTQPSLDHWRQLLIDFYLASHDLSDAWPPLKTVQFVQLALVQQKENTQHIGLRTVTGDIDAIYGHKTNTDFLNLFMDLKRSSLYLLEGRPGSGKTTLMTHVTRQWAEGKILTSQSIKFVFLVQLRRFGGRENVDLKDLLQSACSDFSTEDMQGIFDYICKNHGEGVVFVLDGFDEYAHGQNLKNFISRLIMKKRFCRSIVIVSSRPAATRPFRLTANKYIEVVGFFKEQVIQYISCCFEQRGEVERARRLIHHLEEHPNLMNLCYLPLHCAMLVFLYEEDSVLPNTETEFYRDFTLSILRRSICKQSEHTNPPCVTELIDSVDCLVDNKRKIFDRICKLAFEATIASQQVFKKSQIDKICINISPCNVEGSLGLVAIDRYFVKYGIDETYTFLHLTLQEYLAAVHIAGLSESEQTRIVVTHRHQKHLYILWRFLFGVLNYSKESTVNLFKLILDTTSDDLLLHVRCAYESQHNAACTDVLHFHENCLKFERKDNWSPFDLACVTYVLETAKYTTIKLNFKTCDFSVNDVVALLKGVGDHRLSLAVHQGETVQSVLDALSLGAMPDLIELDLFGGGSESVSMKNNLKDNTNLKKLRLININTNFGLEEGFKHWPNLEKLDIRGTSCPLTVLEAIKYCTNLVELTLEQCDLAVSEAQTLGESLKFTSKLHSINLRLNSFGDDGLQALSEGIKNCEKLQKLNLMECNLGVSGARVLGEIKRSSTLHTIGLGSNPIGDEGLQNLSGGIKNCEELKELYLWKNNLTDKSVPHLTELIKSARNLDKLNLRRNQFAPKGEEQIKEAVRERNSVGGMTELKLEIW